MLVRQSRRALSYTLARKEYSDTSGADGIGRGLKTNFNFPEGTEHTRWQGARHDSPEWWRKLNMFYMTCQHYPTIGLLYNDRYPLDQEYQGWSYRMRSRLGVNALEQFCRRHTRASTYEMRQDIMPFEEQPGLDADHYYLEKVVGPQCKGEYEEMFLVDCVTGDHSDVHADLRKYFWFRPTRFFQIMEQSKKNEGEMTVNSETGQLDRNDTIASSFVRSAF